MKLIESAGKRVTFGNAGNMNLIASAGWRVTDGKSAGKRVTSYNLLQKAYRVWFQWDWSNLSPGERKTGLCRDEWKRLHVQRVYGHSKPKQSVYNCKRRGEHVAEGNTSQASNCQYSPLQCRWTSTIWKHNLSCTRHLPVHPMNKSHITLEP